MITQDARSVRLTTKDKQQISPRTKAADIIFSDGIDLQTKFRRDVVAPKIEVIVNTPTEFRIRIKSINGIIVTPNLRGADTTALEIHLRQLLEELEGKIDSLGPLTDVSERLTRMAEDITTVNERTLETDRRVINLETRLDDVYTKTEIGNIVSDCITNVSLNDDSNALVVQKANEEHYAVPLFASLSSDEIDSIF